MRSRKRGERGQFIKNDEEEKKERKIDVRNKAYQLIQSFVLIISWIIAILWYLP